MLQISESGCINFKSLFIEFSLNKDTPQFKIDSTNFRYYPFPRILRSILWDSGNVSELFLKSLQ